MMGLTEQEIAFRELDQMRIPGRHQRVIRDGVIRTAQIETVFSRPEDSLIIRRRTTRAVADDSFSGHAAGELLMQDEDYMASTHPFNPMIIRYSREPRNRIALFYSSDGKTDADPMQVAEVMSLIFDDAKERITAIRTEINRDLSAETLDAPLVLATSEKSNGMSF